MSAGETLIMFLFFYFFKMRKCVLHKISGTPGYERRYKMGKAVYDAVIRIWERKDIMGAGENVKVRKTYCLANEKTQEVLGECGSDERLKIRYYENGKTNILTQVVAETITDTEVTFSFLGTNGFADDNRRPVTVSSDQFVDWKIKVEDHYLVNERTGEEIQAGRLDDTLMALTYYNEQGERDVITKVGIEKMTDTEVTFYHLDSWKTITMPVQKIIDWIR